MRVTQDRHQLAQRFLRHFTLGVQSQYQLNTVQCATGHHDEAS